MIASDKVSVWLPAKLREVSMGKNSTSQYYVSVKKTKITALALAPSMFAPDRDLAAQSLPRSSKLLVSFGFPIITESQKV